MKTEKTKPRLSSNQRVAISLAAGIAIVTFILYFPTHSFSWVGFDDNDYVTDNAHVATGLRTANMAWAFTHFHAGYWIPATWISHMIDCQIWGSDAGPPHLVNAALHSCNALLLFLLLYTTTGAMWRGLIVAALFAWHPLRVESVAWLAERKDVLSTFFWVLAMLAYVRFVRSGKFGWYLSTAALFLVGLMSKPTLVTLPVSLLLLDVFPLRRTESSRWTALIVEKAPLFLISAVFSILTLITQAAKGAMSDLHQVPLTFRLSNALVSYCRYLIKTFYPVDLIAFYPLPTSIPIWHVITSAAVLLSITVCAIRMLKTRPYLAIGWLWFLATLFPMIGLFQAGGQAMADRFSYVPLIGIFIAVVWGFEDLASKREWARRVLPAASVVALACCLILSAGQMRQWRDAIALFSRVLAIAGSVPIAHDHLGAALYEKGDPRGATEHFRAALHGDPSYPDAHNNLATVLFQSGDRDEAFAEFREALRLDPNYARAHNNYGNALLQSGNFAGAVTQYEEALRIKPDYWAARNNLGAAFLKLGEKNKAIQQFQEALRLNPSFQPAQRNLNNEKRASDAERQ